VIIAVVVLGFVLALGYLQGSQTRGYLDPGGVDQGGARAVVRILEGLGVEVTAATTTDDAVAATSPDDTMLVTAPDLLRPEQVDRLLATGADLVLVAPTASAPMFDPGLRVSDIGPAAEVSPECDLAAARDAGTALMGGVTYDVEGATGCYPVGGAPSLVAVDRGASRLVVLGSASALTNEHLDSDGNAALILDLLGARDSLTWYRPTLEAPGDAATPLTDQFPSWVWPVAWQLGIAAALAAVWRGRRLGPLVHEPLPVVVRAAETTEGRARLYRRGRARAHAATLLRQAALRRLRSRLGQPPDAPVETIVDTVAARARRSPAEVAALLAGPAPTDDAGLVRLANDLDALETEARTP
jgi:hypothetical protein